jgi:hypothetical protein
MAEYIWIDAVGGVRSKTRVCITLHHVCTLESSCAMSGVECWLGVCHNLIQIRVVLEHMPLIFKGSSASFATARARRLVICKTGRRLSG